MNAAKNKNPISRDSYFGIDGGGVGRGQHWGFSGTLHGPQRWWGRGGGGDPATSASNSQLGLGRALRLC